MQHLEQLNSLIDRASAIAGSDRALADTLGVHKQKVSNWRHGIASCSPEDQALLADVAGLDPVAELARATVAKHAGTAKGDALLRALGKSSLAIGGVLASAGVHAASLLGTISTPSVLAWVNRLLDTMYRPVKFQTAQSSTP